MPATTIPTEIACNALARGGRGGAPVGSGARETSAAARYRSTPTPPARVRTTKASLTTTGSMPSRSPIPPATPVRTRSPALRVNRRPTRTRSIRPDALTRGSGAVSGTFPGP